MNSVADWDLVKSFLAVVDTGSFSAAAKQLRTSQPTVGRHIQTFEQALGAELFTRHARGFSLTQKGRDILPYAQSMQEAVAQMMVVTPEDSLEGTVRITASHFVCRAIMPQIIAILREAYPEIAIDLLPSDTSENLLFREADLAVRMYRPTQLDIVAKKLGEIPLGIVAAKSYIDRKGVPTSAYDFEGHDLIGFDQNDLILKTMQSGGIPATRDWFSVRCDNQAIYWDRVRAGCGIGFTQIPVAEMDDSLVVLSKDVGIPPLPVWIATHETLFKSPRIKAVWSILIEEISKFI